MTKIDLVTDDEINEALRLVEVANDAATPCSQSDAAVDRLLVLVPKMAAHLAALKAAGTEALAFLEQAAEPESSYGHYHGGDPRQFEPSEDECSPEEIAAHKAACEAWARGERPDIRKACEPNREPIVLTDKETGEQRTIEAGTALALYAPFGIGLITYEPDADAVRARDMMRAALGTEAVQS